MEYLNVRAEVLLRAPDDRAFQRAVGVTLGRHDHADHRLRLELRLRQARHVPARAGQQIGNDVPRHAHHQDLAFRVAEAGVELDNPGTFIGRHQSDVEHALVGRALGRHGLQRRLYDPAVGGHHHRLVEHRRRRIGPHAARVGAQVAVEGPLVILGPAEKDGAFAVAQGEQRSLLAFHELLDHDARTGRTESPAQHPLDLGLGVAAVGADRHPLARRQTVRLDDIGGFEHGQRSLGVLDPVIDAVMRGRDLVPLQEGLGEGLGRLQLRRLGAGAETGNAGRVQQVRETGRKSDFGPDDHQTDLQLPRQPGQAFGVVGADVRHAFSDLADAGISGRAEQAVNQRRLPHFPGKGVLAPSRSDQQDIHARGMAARAPLVKAADCQSRAETT